MNALTPQSRSARKMIKEECDERLKLLPVYMTASWTMVLLDKGHIEACEMQEILVEVEKLYQSITGNYISFEDVCRAVETEYGVRLNFVDNIKDKNPWLRKIADKNPVQKTLPLPVDPNEDALVEKVLKEMGVNRNEPPHWKPNIHKVVDQTTGKVVRERQNGFICSYCGKHSWYTTLTCSGCNKRMVGGADNG